MYGKKGHAGRGKGNGVKKSWYPDAPSTSTNKSDGKGSSSDGAKDDPWSQWNAHREDGHRSHDQNWDTWGSQGWGKQASWWSKDDQWTNDQWEPNEAWRTDEWQEAEDHQRKGKGEKSISAETLTRSAHALSRDAKEFVPSSMRQATIVPAPFQRQPVVADVVADVAPNVASASEPLVQSAPTREDLKRQVFEFFDSDHDGRLRSQDLRKFAEQTGFEGADDEWSHEYRLICEEMQCRMQDGLNVTSFSRLVDDQSDNGCYCTDAELIAMLPQRSLQPAMVEKPDVSHPAPSLVDGHKEVSSSVPTSREDLRVAVFHHFDTDHDGRLRSQELRKFAEQTGFEGGDDEWSREYELICKELNLAPSTGLSNTDFNAMVDDDSNDGCYCSDDELRAMLAQSVGKENHVASNLEASSSETERIAQQSSGCTQTREDLKLTAFKLFDIDRDGRLKVDELHEFAKKTGFDGSQEDWKWEYESLCQECGCNPKDGIGKTEFNRLVDDESENGCYSSNEELTEILQAVASQQSNHVPANGSAKETENERVQEDLWAQQQDPWSTAEAQWIHERQKNQEKKKVAREEKAAAESWGKYSEAVSKPALDMKKLLEASRSANAARKAKEQEEANKVELMRPDPPPIPSETEAVEDAIVNDSGYVKNSRKDASSSSRARAARITTTPAALAVAGTTIAQLAAGDSSAAATLVNIVAGAPNSSHVLAVVSTTLRLLIQGRIPDARTLLGLEHLLMDPAAGETCILRGVCELARSFDSSAAPFLLRLMLPLLLKADAKSSAVRSLAIDATQLIAESVDSFAFEALMQPLLSALDAKRSPAVKLHAFKLLVKCGKGEGEQAVAHKLPQLIPVVTTLLTDVNSDVKTAASEYAEVLFALSKNKDLEPYGDDILSCERGKRDVAKCVKELAEVVFVQRFEAPALAVIMPVLLMGLKSRNMRTQRQASIVAENVCKLVPSIADVQPFAPHLLPLLKRIGEDTSDPDVRQVATRAHKSLASIADADMAGAVREKMRNALTEVAAMVESDANKGGDVFTPCPASVSGVIIGYLVTLCVGFGNCNVIKRSTWKDALMPHLEPLLGGRAEECVDFLFEMGRDLSTDGDEKNELTEDTEEGGDCEAHEILCDCTFTLACGASTLLRSAHLKLMRGCVYGLVGANDSGKSALLRAIHDRKVVGFPPVNEVLSVFVEHGVGEKPPECDLTPLEYLLADPTLKSMGMQKGHIVATLKNLGFGDRSNTTLKTLSGGWRMKLGLARAMLQEANILLLDEPTGHLDAAHVDWLVDYIHGLQSDKKDVTTVIVSHNAAFLDRVCTHIIHAQGQKLTTYSGNFGSFIERVPDAQLGSAAGEEEKPLATFVLPQPGSLEGVRSQGKRFLCLEDVSYSYPKATRVAVNGVTVECSLRTRVGIVGPNGAGKSTLAALLVGELLPDTGNTWRHPNLRMAFVAQHAFHHLEQHLDLTATQYILWRFEGNEDREALDFLADEAESETSRTYCMQDGCLVPCHPEDEDVAEPEHIVDRRQRGRLGYEYEVRWRKAHVGTSWVPRWQLAAMGYIGMVRREDARQAAQHSLIDRPLTSPGVEMHLAGFGLDKEEASHRRLGALSYGQRARAVLGAATWLAPHLLVLDEPSNYLDPPALTALAAGLQSFGGGLIVISHNHAFLEEVCAEHWVMEMGKLRREKSNSKAEEIEAEEFSTQTGGSANIAAREAKEKKKQKRLRDIRRKNGEVVESDDDEWWEDLLKKTSGK